jgi:hypothetical protein
MVAELDLAFLPTLFIELFVVMGVHIAFSLLSQFAQSTCIRTFVHLARPAQCSTRICTLPMANLCRCVCTASMSCASQLLVADQQQQQQQRQRQQQEQRATPSSLYRCVHSLGVAHTAIAVCAFLLGLRPP